MRFFLLQFLLSIYLLFFSLFGVPVFDGSLSIGVSVEFAHPHQLANRAEHIPTKCNIIWRKVRKILCSAQTQIDFISFGWNLKFESNCCASILKTVEIMQMFRLVSFGSPHFVIVLWYAQKQNMEDTWRKQTAATLSYCTVEFCFAFEISIAARYTQFRNKKWEEKKSTNQRESNSSLQTYRNHFDWNANHVTSVELHWTKKKTIHIKW